MGFWSRLLGDHRGITANTNPPSDPPTVGVADYTPGDPDGLTVEGEQTFNRSFPGISPSPWDGWPESWAVPNWQDGIRQLAGTAWDAVDLNSRVLAAMPVYRLQSGRIGRSPLWMTNPDPTIYASWFEFAKEVFWDFHLGETFILAMARNSENVPVRFRVVPPWAVSVELLSGFREYRIGGESVTDDILHIRYRSSTADARGHGPLESAGARLVAAELLAMRVNELAETGGATYEWLHTDKYLNRTQSDDMQDRWVTARREKIGPPMMSGGVDLKHASTMSAKDLALLELSQFNEARIAIKLGVPPFLVGLPSGGDSMTYNTVAQLFDFHDRSSLRPTATAVMSALSGWALPRGQSAELNRDEYSRPGFSERAEAYAKLAGIEQDGRRALGIDEIRAMERLTGDAPEVAAAALTGDES